MCEECRAAFRRRIVDHRDVVVGHDGARVEIEMSHGDNPTFTATERKELHEFHVEAFRDAAAVRAKQALDAARMGVSVAGGRDPVACAANGHGWVRANGRCYWCDAPVET